MCSRGNGLHFLIYLKFSYLFISYLKFCIYIDRYQAPPMRHFFFNPCKLCRQIQATALLGHMPCDEKFFGWIFKEGSTISEDDLQKIKDDEAEKARDLRKALKEKAKGERKARTKEFQEKLLIQRKILIQRYMIFGFVISGFVILR